MYPQKKLFKLLSSCNLSYSVSPQPAARARGCCRQGARQYLIDGVCVTSNYPSTRRTCPGFIATIHGLEGVINCLLPGLVASAKSQYQRPYQMVNVSVNNMNSHHAQNPCPQALVFGLAPPLSSRILLSFGVISTLNISRICKSHVRSGSLELNMQVASSTHKSSQCSLLASLAK